MRIKFRLTLSGYERIIDVPFDGSLSHVTKHINNYLFEKYKREEFWWLSV
jgi:hypothetical protein